MASSSPYSPLPADVTSSDDHDYDNDSDVMSIESSPPNSPDPWKTDSMPTRPQLKEPFVSPRTQSQSAHHQSALTAYLLREAGLNDQAATKQDPLKSSTSSEERQSAESHHAIHTSRLELIEDPRVRDMPSHGDKIPPPSRFEGPVRQLQKMVVKFQEMPKSDQTAVGNTLNHIRRRLSKLQNVFEELYSDQWPIHVRQAFDVKTRAEQILATGQQQHGYTLELPFDSVSSNGNIFPRNEVLTICKRDRSRSPAGFRTRKICSPYSTESSFSTDPYLRQLSSTSTTSGSSASTVSESEIEELLDDLSDSIYRNVMNNLCPDNMRGSFCKTPEECLRNKRFLACPEYAILKKCSHDCPGVFTHHGFKHTATGCTTHHASRCKKKHADGRPCRVEIVYFHVRASCITLRGGRHCQKLPCEWGHDLVSIRKTVMNKKS